MQPHNRGGAGGGQTRRQPVARAPSRMASPGGNICRLPPGRLRFVVAFRAALVQPCCRMAAWLVRCSEQPARACCSPHGRARRLSRAAQSVWCMYRLRARVSTLYKGPKHYIIVPCPPEQQDSSVWPQKIAVSVQIFRVLRVQMSGVCGGD